MNKIIKLAWRSIWRNRRRTIITISSIAFGLIIATFFIAFANGVYGKMIDDAVRMLGGHVTIEHPEYREAPSVDLRVGGLEQIRDTIESWPQVERTKPLILGQGVAKSGFGAVGVAIIGVQPSKEKASSPMAEHIRAGSYLDDEDGARVVIGSQLAKQLKLGKRDDARRIAGLWKPYLEQFGLSPSGRLEELARVHLAVGKKLVISSTDVEGQLVEQLLRVEGVFEVGTPEIDGYMIQVPINFARTLFHMAPGEVTQLGVVVRDPDQQGRVLQKVHEVARAQRVAVLPWDQVMPDLAAYIKVDGGSNYVFQGIIIFLIMFTIFNTILMSVLERNREFAVLLAIGTSPGRLKAQVILETAFIGLLGCVLGLSLGALVTWGVAIDGLDISSFYQEGISVSGFAIDPVIRPELTGTLVAWLGALVFCATMVLGLYPMRKAGRVPMADLLR